MALNNKNDLLNKCLRGGLSFVVILIIWQLLANLNLYNPTLLPPPTRFLKAFYAMFQEGVLWSDFQVSLFRYFTGLLLGSSLGIFLGIITGRNKRISQIITPLLNYLRAIPSIALIPLAIVLFGIGEIEKAFIVTWGAMFPVWLNTYIGMINVSDKYIKTAVTLGMTRKDMYKNVYIPSALPFILTGIRISIATAFFALTAAEMVGTSKGLSYRIIFSYEFFQTDRMMSGIIFLGLLALVFDSIFSFATERLFPWIKEAKN